MDIVDPAAPNIEAIRRSVMAMDRKRQEELLIEIEEHKKRQARKKFFQFYPETGPLSRHGYKKHMQFFKAGAVHRERLMMAANRCVTPWTAIETGRATRLVGEMIGEAEFVVRSWGGGSLCNKRASGLFLKGILPAFHVQLDNGEAFQCTGMHLVLTSSGWASIFQIIRGASGLHCWKTSEGCPDSCDRGQGQCDQPPLDATSIDQERLPLRADVLECDHLRHLHVGATVPKYQHSHVFEGLARRSILDDQNQIGDLCAKFQDPASALDDQWPSKKRRVLRQFVDRFSQEQEVREAWSRSPCGALSLGAESEVLLSEGMHKAGDRSVQDPRLYFGRSSVSQVATRFLHAPPYTAIFFPSVHAPLLMGRKIDFVVPVGLLPIIDFTVDDVKNYVSGGVVHHNTGKSEGCGAYEVTAHLTGLYPAWWEGRRFTKAITAWAVGETGTQARDTVQKKLLGDIEDYGTGLIPYDNLGKITSKPGVPNAVDQAIVKHKGGRNSTLTFKTYDQKRESFQGTEVDLIWCDEEPPQDVYTECVLRTMTNNGLVILTFTPLAGMSEVVRSFVGDTLGG